MYSVCVSSRLVVPCQLYLSEDRFRSTRKRKGKTKTGTVGEQLVPKEELVFIEQTLYIMSKRLGRGGEL